MDITNDTGFKRLSSISEISTESCADYTLPDYLGDVRRILFTECEARQSGKYSDENGVEFSGIVAYEIVYLDSENKLSRTSFTSDYDLRSRAGEEERCGAYATPAVSSYTLRLTGPRRISARANVSASVKSICEDELSASGTTFENEERAQTLEETLKLRCCAEGESIEREYAERLERLDGIIADEIEVIYSGAEAMVSQATADEDKIKLEGELVLYALLSVDGSPIYLAEKTVSFEENVPFVDARSDMRFIPRAEVRSAVANVNADEAGAEVVLSAIVEYCALGEYNTQVKAKTDAYITDGDVENLYRDYRYTELVDCAWICENVSCDISSEKVSAEKLREIPYLSATVRVERSELAGGEASLGGELRVAGVASVTDENGEISYTGLKFSVPFEKRVKCAASPASDKRLEYSLSAPVVTAAVDAGSIRINYRLLGSVVVSSVSSKKLLSTSSIVESDAAEARKSITVYYPVSGDTLFGVAKKFRTPVARLAANNGISASASTDGDAGLEGVSRLFIY